jgi:hypothetical protein
MSGYATNSLLKNSFGSSFRGAVRHGISLFVGFWRGGIPYIVRDGVFRSLFQQTANQEFARWNFPEATSGEPGGTYPVMAALVREVLLWGRMLGR